MAFFDFFANKRIQSDLSLPRRKKSKKERQAKVIDNITKMASYDHVKFYDNTQRKQGLTLGGVELVPGLIQISNSSSQSDTNYQKSSAEKHVNIIEYLKTLPKDTRATFVDIKRVLNIDLDIDNDVLDIIKNNPKIDLETAIDGLLSFSYRAKYEIRYFYILYYRTYRLITIYVTILNVLYMCIGIGTIYCV